MELTYCAITPARDEAASLLRLGDAMLAQTIVPTRWVIVDDGSVDETPSVAAALARQHPWITVVTTAGTETAPGAPVVRAFNAGLEAIEGVPDVIVKLDADVSFDERYFEGMLQAFESDPRLGIASGVCHELEDGAWVPRYVTGDHVRGATRAYRAACLDQVGPLPEMVGWDGVDELKANVLGWSTASITGLRFYHHRAVGARDGGRTRRWVAEGRCAHYMGYSPLYLVARTLGRAVRDRDVAAFAMLWSFIGATLRREPQYADDEVRSYLRRQQSIRYLPLRLRESFGRRAV